MATAKPSKDELLVEIDGPGIEPGRVDTLLVLCLATACFELTVKVAADLKAPLTLRGLAVYDACIGVGSWPSNEGAASLAVQKATRIVAGLVPPPRGTTGELEEILRCLRSLPADATAAFSFHDREYPLVPPPLPTTEPPWTITELRVHVVRVGGKDPTVALWSESESKPFVVGVDVENARKLGALLYNEADVSLELTRDIDGHIVAGHVLEVFELSDGGGDAWRQWFAEQTGDWDAVENVGAELGRD